MEKYLRAWSVIHQINAKVAHKWIKLRQTFKNADEDILHNRKKYFFLMILNCWGIAQIWSHLYLLNSGNFTL